jgi:hypothetical protein
MEPVRFRIFLVISFLLFLSLACSLTGSSNESAGSSADTIATSVAATVAAEDQVLQPTWTDSPAVDESESGVNRLGVSFSFDPSLADTVNSEVVPGQGDSNNEIWSTPDHRRFSFSGWLLADVFHLPAIRIYPVAEFQAINSNVSEGLDILSTAIDTQPVDGEGIFVSDLFNAAQIIRSQVSYIQFQNGQGVRYISQYGQAAYPIGWPNLFYTFQGFTDDGLYYISAILPVNHPSLPHPDDVVMDDAFYDNFMDYAAAKNLELDEKDPQSFIPSLIILDGLIESLLISDLP